MNSQIVNEYLNIICGSLLYLRFKLNVFLHFRLVFRVLSNVLGMEFASKKLIFAFLVRDIVSSLKNNFGF